MHEHRAVLEDGHEPAAVDRWDREAPERVGGPPAGHGKRADDPARERDVRCRQLGQPPPHRPTGRARDSREHRGPQQQRARVAGPEPGESVGPRRRSPCRVGHVHEREIEPDERPAEHDGRERGGQRARGQQRQRGACPARSTANRADQRSARRRERSSRSNGERTVPGGAGVHRPRLRRPVARRPSPSLSCCGVLHRRTTTKHDARSGPRRGDGRMTPPCHTT